MAKRLTKLEVAWTLAVVVLLAGIAVWSTFVLYNVDALPPADEYVTVFAAQWSWTFRYENGTNVTSQYNAQTNTVSGGALWVQPGTTVQLNITSLDVDHSLYIPQLGVQMNAIPGRWNFVSFQIPAVAPGTQYIIECTEFCGTGHGTMRSFVIVV
ncbi:MAG: cytochrome c oxidase subunit II [Thermoplasmata archaeon]